MPLPCTEGYSADISHHPLGMSPPSGNLILLLIPILCSFLGSDGYYYLNPNQIQAYFLNENLSAPAYGDVWEISGFETPEGFGPMPMYVTEETTFTYVCNIFTMEDAETKTVTVTDMDDMWVYFSDGDSVVFHQGEQVVDWESLRVGDKVSFIGYNGCNTYKIATGVSYLGDANSDNAVTIADVIFLNRQILGDTGTARSTFNQELADYDDNGIIDAADSLMILKRIVELICEKPPRGLFYARFTYGFIF